MAVLLRVERLARAHDRATGREECSEDDEGVGSVAEFPQLAEGLPVVRNFRPVRGRLVAWENSGEKDDEAADDEHG